MCQLVAYIGDRPIAHLVLKALELQEPYFAGHATGLGVVDPTGKIRVEKATGPVARVKKTTRITKLRGTYGIGHARYSALARDDPRYCTDEMAHPFTNDAGDIALVHNGEISNFKDHWGNLKEKHRFKSYNPTIDWITDSEIAVHMVDELHSQGKGIDEALMEVMPQLSGTVLLCLISSEDPEKIYIANRHQPCYIGVGDEEAMWCSSKIGFKPIEGELKKIWAPPKNSLIKLTRGKAEIGILDPNYKTPDLKLNKRMLKEAILRILELADLDFQRLWYALHKSDWGKCYGISQEEWLALRKDKGVSIVNPFIETLDELVIAGKILQRIDYRMEGCTNRTPRFAYSLA